MNTRTKPRDSAVAELLSQLAEEEGYDGTLIDSAVEPDNRNVVYFEDDGGVAVRTRHHIADGGTQGGTRLLLLRDDATGPDVETALEHSYDLSAVMTLKTGNIEAAMIRAAARDRQGNAWFRIPKTGGAKGVLMMRARHHADPERLERHLRTFVQGHLEQIQHGDGIGPDMGVSPEMMNIMGDEAAICLGEAFRRQFTNRGQFPGRDEATGRYAVAAMRILSAHIPFSQRTHVIQGMGSAGGHYARILQQEYAQEGHRVVAVGDSRHALVAIDRSKGLRWGEDYTVDERGSITWWNEDTAQTIGAEEILYVPATIKTLAAIGGVITQENYRTILGNRLSKDRTRVIIEIANMGIQPDAAREIEDRTDVIIGAAPFVSAGGVLASLWERHEPLLARRLGRQVAYSDVADALMLLAACNAEVVEAAAAAEKIGFHAASHRLGFRQQFMS